MPHNHSTTLISLLVDLSYMTPTDHVHVHNNMQETLLEGFCQHSDGPAAMNHAPSSVRRGAGFVTGNQTLAKPRSHSPNQVSNQEFRLTS